MELDKAYKKVQRINKQLKELAEVLKPQFPEYGNPFEHVTGVLSRSMAELRKSLIERAVDRCWRQYMPNAKPDVDFKKLMDEKAGEDGFRESVIERWFKRATASTESLKAQSLQHLKDVASRLVPSGYYKGVWGPPKHVKELVKGRFLRLRCYTWDSGKYGGLRTFHGTDQVTALEKLIAIATERKNPIDVEGGAVGIYHHMFWERDPAEFYKKVEVDHKAVKSFRFFKNGALQIEFKTERQAKKVAKLLIS